MSDINPQAWIEGFRKQNPRVGDRSLRTSNTTVESRMDASLMARGADAGAASSAPGPNGGNDARRWLDKMVARANAAGPFAEFTVVTPDIAQALLDRNPSNRRIVAAGIRKWSAALRAGDWKLNGESIVVADTGQLNDGQHRCMAIIETGIGMPTLVVFGVARESRDTIDQGAKRTNAHILGMRDVPNASLVAAALKFLINIEAGVNLFTHRSAVEIERSYTRHPDIAANAGPAQRAAREFHISSALMVALHYSFAINHPEKSAEFFRMLADGTSHGKNHPTWVLRRRLTENLGNKAKLPITEIGALVIKAMQAFAEDRPISLLRWATNGAKGEPFPKVP